MVFVFCIIYIILLTSQDLPTLSKLMCNFCLDFCTKKIDQVSRFIKSQDDALRKRFWIFCFVMVLIFCHFIIYFLPPLDGSQFHRWQKKLLSYQDLVVGSTPAGLFQVCRARGGEQGTGGGRDRSVVIRKI